MTRDALLQMFYDALDRLLPRRMACANRTIWTFTEGHEEVTVIRRDLNRADGHSREELMEMLATIRREEALTGWKVPEPEVPKEEQHD